VTAGGRTSSLRVNPVVMKGESHTKSNATKIGGGAALGAIIGAIAGGGKGAAVGTVAGGAAGTRAAAAPGKKAKRIPPETVIAFVTSTDTAVSGPAPTASSSSSSPVTVMPPTSASNSSSSTSSASTTSSAVSATDSLFSLRDQRVIRNCVADHSSELSSDV